MFNYKYKNNEILWDYSMSDSNSKDSFSFAELSRQTQINSLSIPRGFMPLLPSTFGQPLHLYTRLGVSLADYKNVLRVAYPDVDPNLLNPLEE